MVRSTATWKACFLGPDRVSHMGCQRVVSPSCWSGVLAQRSSTALPARMACGDSGEAVGAVWGAISTCRTRHGPDMSLTSPGCILQGSYLSPVCVREGAPSPPFLLRSSQAPFFRRTLQASSLWVLGRASGPFLFIFVCPALTRTRPLVRWRVAGWGGTAPSGLGAF
jgi:hypothetical protein